jgi:hypothetical protein
MAGSVYYLSSKVFFFRRRRTKKTLCPLPPFFAVFLAVTLKVCKKEKKVEDIWKWSGKNLINFFEKEKSVSD